jgi:hypothetical protein
MQIWKEVIGGENLTALPPRPITDTSLIEHRAISSTALGGIYNHSNFYHAHTWAMQIWKEVIGDENLTAPPPRPTLIIHKTENESFKQTKPNYLQMTFIKSALALITLSAVTSGKWGNH